MNLLSKNNIKNLLKQYNIKPSKRLGQNFLIDKTALNKFVRAVNQQLNDTILEIGPGLGIITQKLAEKAKVTAVEKDRQIAKILNATLKSPNIKIIQEDILKYNPKKKGYKIAGNLPFYVAAPVIRKFLEHKNPPEEITIIIQKEVAQRICAKPPKMSILAVSVQFYAKPKIISYISKKSFWPYPKVDAAIIKISEINNLKQNKDLFFKIVKQGFSHPRKQLVNNLSNKTNKEKIKSWLLKNNIQPSQRAETLSIDDWVNLTNTCKLFTC